MKLLSLLLCFGVFFLVSCSNCEDVKIGSIDLTDSYRDYSDIENRDQLSFNNDDGSTIVFSARREEGFGFLSGRVVGNGKDWEFGDYTCNEYYEIQNINITLETEVDNQGTLINFFVRHRITDPDQENELIEILFSWINDRATSEAVDGAVQATYNITSGRVESIVSELVSVNELSSIIIRNQEYQDVIEFITDDGISALYLQKGVGPVAFIRDGVTYTRVD